MKLVPPPEQKRERKLVAVTKINYAGLIVAGIKLVDKFGDIIVSFPAEAQHRYCSGCNSKCEFRHRYCPWCGVSLIPVEIAAGKRGYIDLVHPANSSVRRHFERVLFRAFDKECDEFKNDPHYRPANKFPYLVIPTRDGDFDLLKSEQSLDTKNKE